MGRSLWLGLRLCCETLPVIGHLATWIMRAGMLQVAKSLITGFNAPHSRACFRGDSSCPQDRIDMQSVKGEFDTTIFGLLEYSGS